MFTTSVFVAAIRRARVALSRSGGWMSGSGRVAGAMVLLAACAGSGRALAQGTARSLDLDPSPISSGMGAASTGVFWTAEPNYWANPALLGYYRGLRWQYGRTQLVPGLANDVFFTTRRVTVGLPGIAVALAGKPFEEVGGLDLDYGANQGTDENGNPVISNGSHEEIDSWSAGVSAAKLIDGVAALFGATLPPIGRYFDVAAGYAEKDFVVNLSPGITGTGTAHDHGVLIRGGIGSEMFDHDGPPVRFDLSYGYSVQNHDDVEVVFTNQDIAVPLTRIENKGVALRAAVGVPKGMQRSGNGAVRWLAEGADHVVAIGYAHDKKFWGTTLPEGSFGATQYETEHHGVELDLMNVVALRYGHYRDALGDIDGDTWGIGVTARWSSIAGVRYDYGTLPQARDSGLRDLQRHQISVFLDPFSLSRRMR
jgi:hypothetical protein